MPPPLANKIALVTGASRGIGYATARSAGDEGDLIGEGRGHIHLMY